MPDEPETILCAKCEQPLSFSEPVAMAATSTNFAMLFHPTCLSEMHACAVEIDDDLREMVLRSVGEAWSGD